MSSLLTRGLEEAETAITSCQHAAKVSLAFVVGQAVIARDAMSESGLDLVTGRVVGTPNVALALPQPTVVLLNIVRKI